jgi:hypothetical protein
MQNITAPLSSIQRTARKSGSLWGQKLANLRTTSFHLISRLEKHKTAGTGGGGDPQCMFEVGD